MTKATARDQAEIIGIFKKAAWEVDLKRYDDLSLDDPISSLGLGSVALMEILGILEDELEIHLPEEELASVKTVGDLVVVAQEARCRS